MKVDSSNRSSPQAYFSPRDYWENRLNGDFSLRGVGYSLLGSRYAKWQYRLRDSVLRRELARLQLDLSNANVLDVGSGTGFYIEYWLRTGVGSVSGCDLTEASVSRLRMQFPDQKFLQLDIGSDLPVGFASRFDVVSAFDVLFHIVDDVRFERAFRNFSRMLVPGGLLCFSELFLHHETERGIHVVFRPLSHIETVLAESGFEIIVRRPAFVLMNEPFDTQSAVARFLWMLTLYPARKNELFGWLCGAALYPADLLLTRLLSESPTTEVMFCRKLQ
jgi:SAM-dependent methyltransferase